MPIQRSLREVESEIDRLRKQCPHPKDQLINFDQYRDTGVDSEEMIHEFHVYCYECGVCGASLEFMSEQHGNEEDEE